MKTAKRLTWGCATLLLASTGASGWEPESTNVGLTEQAALTSTLHKTLVDRFGMTLGLYDDLTLPPGTAPSVDAALAKVAPSSGVVPDKRGEQSALSWLLAGAVVEGSSPDRQRNHFYDPVHKTGLTAKGSGLGELLIKKVWGQKSPKKGIAAPDWVLQVDNEHGIQPFWKDLEAAVSSAKPEERSAHMALALVHAGAIASVLEDVGSPSRARDDLAEHLQPLGGGQADRGSRFERIAALTYGRLGVPAPTNEYIAANLRGFFTGDGTGLADVTAAHWFSSGTLPPASGKPRFPSPMPDAIDVAAAQSDQGVVLADEQGVCLARYRVQDGRLDWFIPDECAAEQVAAILPTVGAYATGLLDWMFRGQLGLEVKDGSVTVTVQGSDLGHGTLRLYGEDASGVRSPLGDAIPVTEGGLVKTVLATQSIGDASAVAAVFVGVDASGEQLVAAGYAKR